MLPKAGLLAITSEVIARPLDRRDAHEEQASRGGDMKAHRILQLNALSTVAGAAGMLAVRRPLFPLFGLGSPQLLDIIAVGLLAYAGVLALVTRNCPIGRAVLIAATIGDAVWIAGSAVVLLLFWSQLAPLARLLVIAVAFVVDVFAIVQYRAAVASSGRAAGAASVPA
jgi:hypothetical protein